MPACFSAATPGILWPDNLYAGGTDAAGLLSELASGERRPLARLLTRIEADDPSLRPLLPELFRAGHGAHVVGVTGPPGSGKSTLVNALTAEWRRRGRRVGILAIDPSSPYTGGAIMGDRIRMMEHAADRDVFMRSMASRGELGGLAAATWLAVAALDAAAYDPIVIETVGAGQSEVEIARLNPVGSSTIRSRTLASAPRSGIQSPPAISHAAGSRWK